MANEYPSTTWRFIVENDAAANLATGINDSALVIVLDNSGTPPTGITYDYTNFPEPTVANEELSTVTIEDEIILYVSRSGDTITVYDEDTDGYGILSAGQNGRGYQGTTATTHAADNGVFHNVEKSVIDQNQEAIILLESNKAVDSEVVHDTGAETVAGVKTFTSFPVTPSSLPTTDYQVANKIYVNNQVAAIGSAFILGSETIDGGVSIKDPVWYDNTSSSWKQADQYNPPEGVCTDTTEVTLSGKKTGLTGLTDKTDYFLDDSGGLTTTITRVYIGTASGTTTLFINIQFGFYKIDIPRNNLLMEYIFSDNANDTSGNSENLTATDFAYAEGNIGKELTVNGSTTVGIKVTAALKTQVFTITGWITVTDASAGSGFVIISYSDNDDAASKYGWQLSQAGDSLTLQARDSSGASLGTAIAATFNQDNTKIFFAITCDDTDYNMYIDDIYNIADTNTQPTFVFNTNMGIGIGGIATSTPGGSTKSGKIDQLRVFDKVLNVTELLQLKKEDQAVFND